jgi:hypothetical protein
MREGAGGGVVGREQGAAGANNHTEHLRPVHKDGQLGAGVPDVRRRTNWVVVGAHRLRHSVGERLPVVQKSGLRFLAAPPPPEGTTTTTHIFNHTQGRQHLLSLGVWWGSPH